MAKPTVIPNVPKNITIRELEKMKDSSVFVVNASPRTHRGDILFQVSRPNGDGADIVRVHKTWIPQDLADQIPREQLMASANFRQTVSKGLIELIHPDYAEGVLKSEDAKEELGRLRNMMSAANAILNSASVTDHDERTPTQRRRDINQTNEANEKAEEEARAEEVSGVQDSKIVAFDSFLNTLEGKQETEVINALRNEGGFSRAEIKKILARFGDDYPRVKKWAEKLLQK